MPVESTSTLIHGNTQLITRDQLAMITVPETTRTHKPVPHHEVVQALVETLGFRHISVSREQYAVSADGMKMFGVLDLETTFHGCRFAIGIRNANDKSFRLALTVGYRVFCCDNMAFNGDFEPSLAKHSKSLSILNMVSISVDSMQRNFEGMKQNVERWMDSRISDDRARLIVYKAFTQGELDAPRHLDRLVHRHYFEPEHPEFQERSMWSLSNAFTSAFKVLEPIPLFRATAKLAPFLAAV